MFRSIFLLFIATAALAQHHHPSQPSRPVEKFTGGSNLHHPLSTRNAEAQKSFDQGLALLYGFNHHEAMRAFERAAKHDPQLAMAYWGIALVNGLNYNAPEFPDGLAIARQSLKKAQELSVHASAAERAYIAALGQRYSSEDSPEKREAAYAEAMRAVMESHPDDLDAATLYAESMMNQTPWQLWSKDGKPGPNTERVIAVLETVLRRNPHHIGANHYYIHAVEASLDPHRALAAADRLRNLKLSAGHLVHMPAHIYWRTGDYVSAADVNVLAADADRAYIAQSDRKSGFYAMLYYSHNIHFQALADAQAGRYQPAIVAAKKLTAHVSPALKEMPMVEGFLPVQTYVLARFGKWDEVLKLPEPDASLALHHNTWRWARGMAFAAKKQIQAADRELQMLRVARGKIPADVMVDKNPLTTILEVAENMLAGNIARAKGENDQAVKHYQTAASLHDSFNYIEPPEWPFSTREPLGAMLIAQGRAAEAEAVFRKDLQHNPRSGRALFGLMESLKAQNKREAARLVEMEFQDAWKDADIKLSLNDL